MTKKNWLFGCIWDNQFKLVALTKKIIGQNNQKIIGYFNQLFIGCFNQLLVWLF